MESRRMPNTACPSCQTQCRQDLEFCVHCGEKLLLTKRDSRRLGFGGFVCVLLLMYLALALFNRAHYGYSFSKSLMIFVARLF